MTIKFPQYILSSLLVVLLLTMVLPSAALAQSGYRCSEDSQTPLYILLKPNGKHFYTTNEDEANYTLKLGYKMEGIVAYILKERLNSSESSAPLHRFYNSFTDSHRYFLGDNVDISTNSTIGRYEGVVGFLYTNLEVGFAASPITVNYAANDSITDVLFSRDYSPELWRSWGYNRIDVLGYACSAGYANAKQNAIYRLWNPTTLKHFYTNDLAEANSVVKSSGYKSEGIIGYLYDQPQSHMNTVAVFRMYHPTQKKHFYTTNTLEFLEAEGRGYVGEGVLGYAINDTQRQRGALVLRLYNSKINDHFYVLSNPGMFGDSEADRAFESGYQREGDLGTFSAW